MAPAKTSTKSSTANRRPPIKRTAKNYLREGAKLLVADIRTGWNWRKIGKWIFLAAAAGLIVLWILPRFKNKRIAARGDKEAGYIAEIERLRKDSTRQNATIRAQDAKEAETKRILDTLYQLSQEAHVDQVAGHEEGKREIANNKKVYEAVKKEITAPDLTNERRRVINAKLLESRKKLAPEGYDLPKR